MSALLGFVVHNWPLKLAAIALATLLYAGLVVSQSPASSEPRPDRGVNQPADAVILGNLPPVTRIRYFATGDLGVRSDRRQLPGDGRPHRRRPGRPARPTVPSSVASSTRAFIVLDYEPPRDQRPARPVMRRRCRSASTPGTTPEGLEIGRAERRAGRRDGLRPGLGRRPVVAAQADVAHRPVRARRRPRRRPDPRRHARQARSRPVEVEPATVHVGSRLQRRQTKTAARHTRSSSGRRPPGYEVDAVTVDPRGHGRGRRRRLATLSRPTRADLDRRRDRDVDTDAELDLPAGVLPVGSDRPRDDHDQGRDRDAGLRRGVVLIGGASRASTTLCRRQRPRDDRRADRRPRPARPPRALSVDLDVGGLGPGHARAPARRRPARPA